MPVLRRPEQLDPVPDQIVAPTSASGRRRAGRPAGARAPEHEQRHLHQAGNHEAQIRAERDAITLAHPAPDHEHHVQPRYDLHDELSEDEGKVGNGFWLMPLGILRLRSRNRAQID